MIFPDLRTCAVCGSATTHLLSAEPDGAPRKPPNPRGIVAAPVCPAHAPALADGVRRILWRISEGSLPSRHPGADVIDCGVALDGCR